jgi:hypothetical protein
MPRGLILGLIAVCVFAAVATILVEVMPGTRHPSDYLIIGSVATLVALLALFLILVSTTLKSTDVFFKRRKK